MKTKKKNVEENNSFKWDMNIPLENVNIAYVDSEENDMVLLLNVPSKTYTKEWDYYYDIIGNYGFFTNVVGEVVPIGVKQPVKKVKEIIPLRYYCNGLDDSLLEPFKREIPNREKCILFYQNLMAEKKHEMNMGKCKIYRKEW